jgi:hypothetical protein
VVQVFAKGPPFHRHPGVTVRRGDHADVISATSSRNRTPPAACSIRPARGAWAPVKAPRS